MKAICNWLRPMSLAAIVAVAFPGQAYASGGLEEPCKIHPLGTVCVEAEPFGCIPGYFQDFGDSRPGITNQFNTIKDASCSWEAPGTGCDTSPISMQITNNVIGNEVRVFLWTVLSGPDTILPGEARG